MASTRHSVLTFSWFFLFCAAVVVALGFGDPARAFDVTACGVTVPVDDVGVLQADLDCPASTSAVVLEDDARLELNGHSITGSFDGGSVPAVECRIKSSKSCTIEGPGEIFGGASACVQIRRGRLSISNVEIHHCLTGIDANTGGPGQTSRVIATNVQTHDNAAYGFIGIRLDASDFDASANGTVGIAARRLRGSAISANGNGSAPECGTYGCSGIFGDIVSAVGVSVSNNKGIGVRCRSLRLTASSLVGNGTNGVLVFDLATLGRPHLTTTTCGKSGKLGETIDKTWGVCAND
jgi:hypothetical protein